MHLESNAWEKKNLISSFAACHFIAWMTGDNYMVAALPFQLDDTDKRKKNTSINDVVANRENYSQGKYA